MGSNCCKGDASRPLRSSSSIYSRYLNLVIAFAQEFRGVPWVLRLNPCPSRAGASLDDRFTSSQDAGGVRLTVSAARAGDSGVYTLQATNAAGKDTARVRLEVSADEAPTGEDPPTFLRRLQDLTVKVGTRTRFLVEIVSSTECKVTWYCNERRLMEAERVSLVRDGTFWCADIAAVSVDDTGRWTCTAENAGGRASCSAHLNVLVPKAYKRPEFVEELRALLTEQGTVSLECKVVGVPTPVLRWFKDSREIKAGDVFALTANAEDPTSLGTYTCEAVNCMGRAYSSSKVHVVGRSREGSARPLSSGVAPESPPIFTKELEDKFVRICEPLTLSCHIVVPPWPRSVVWYNKEGKIEPNERYHAVEDGVGGYLLELPSAEWPDEGEWKCVATSSGGRVGISSCYVSMDVPKNYRKPRFMENLQAVLTEEGLVSFECKVVGFPTPVLSWFKDGQELKPGDVYQLTGTNSLGSYCCIARNCMGQASSSAELTVEDIQNQLNEEEKAHLFSKNQAPKFIQGLKSIEAKIDEPFRFTIKVAIPPEPSVQWYRDEQPVDESTRCHLGKEDRGGFYLDIQSLEFLDQAEWKCVALNDYGHSVTSCFLKLIIPRHYKKPRFLENLQAILSDEGAVNLECKVIGVPQPVLKWYKDGEELKPGDIHRIISGQDGTCCLGTYTCEAQNCMGIAASSASLLGFDDSMKAKAKKMTEEQALQRNLSLSTIHEERTSQMYDTPVGDITLDDKGEISFSFDGKEVSVSLYETPDLTEEEALQIVEMYADQLSENVTEHNVVELPPLRFVKETSTSGNLLMEAIIIDVSPEYFASPDEDLRTEADVEDISIADEMGPSQLSLDQDVGGEDYLEKTMALLSDEKADIPKKITRKKSDSQRSVDDFYSLSLDPSLSEDKKDDDTQNISESFASAKSLGRPKSKSSKPSVDDGQESSDVTKTILFKDELQKQVELTTVGTPVMKPKRERRSSRSSRRSSSGSEKSFNKSKEELVKTQANLESAPPKPCMVDEEFKAKMTSISESLSKVINDVQIIERDIILKSELMSSAATASRSLEIISSLIKPLSEIHSIAEAAKETANESREVSSTLFSDLPKPLKVLQQSLTIIEKCIDVESDNKTLVKKTCVAFIETCGEDVKHLMTDITSITDKNYLSTDQKTLSELHSLVNDMHNVIRFSVDTIKAKNLLSEASEIITEETTVETRHLKDTQKAIFELKSPLNSLLCIVDTADSDKIADIVKVTSSEVILNDMSASIQDLQAALEQIESLSVKETTTSLHKYNTEIIETVMESVLKLRSSFEQLPTETKNDEDEQLLKKALISIKSNLSEIASHIETIEKSVGSFDILQSDNKLEVLQKMAQILILLENNLPRLEPMAEVINHMDIFHKNLTRVLENVIESNEASKYFTLMEICDAVSRLNSSLKNIDSDNVLSLASLSNTLRIIQDTFIKNVFESELNCSIISNITDVLLSIQEALNHAEEISLQLESEPVQDISLPVYDSSRANIVVEHIDHTIATINTVKSIETIKELKHILAPVLENICPVLEELKRNIALSKPSDVLEDEQISEMSDASFVKTLATPLMELNNNLLVLNQVIIDNIESLKEKTEVRSAIAEPLHELHVTLQILQQDVISQYGEDVAPYDVSVNIVSAVQNLQSCMVMVQEQPGIEGVDEMSTLDDISGIKTTAETIPSDRLVLPTADEMTVQHSVAFLDQEIAPSATAQALQILNQHITILQKPEVVEALDTLSEVSDYSSLKSVALGLGELHTGIEEILHPFVMENSSDIANLINTSKLAAIAEPMQELQQSLSVLDTSNIPIYEHILEIPTEKIYFVLQSISDFKQYLEKCIEALFPAMETADKTIEISNKVEALREVCENLKSIFETTKEISKETPVKLEVLILEETVDNLLDATDVSKGIQIHQVKSITEELFEKVITVQEELIQFTPHNLEKLAEEARLIQAIDEIENNIAVLEQYDFVDLSRASEIASCATPQLAMEIESEPLVQMDDILQNAVNVIQESAKETPLADLMILEDFFKTCKSEFTIIRLIISKTLSHKRIIRLIQEFTFLQNIIKDFKIKRSELQLSDDIDGYLKIFFLEADGNLKTIQKSLLKLICTQSELLFRAPINTIHNAKESLVQLAISNEELKDVVSCFINVIEVAEPILQYAEDEINEELNNPTTQFAKTDDKFVIEKLEGFLKYTEDHSSSSSVGKPTKEVILKLNSCLHKHQDYKDATETGKKLIILKCLAECTQILQAGVTGKELEKTETNEVKLEDNALNTVLTEILEPLHALHSQLKNIQEQVTSGVEEQSVSVDITTTESMIEAVSEIHKEIVLHVESAKSTIDKEDISLIIEADKEINAIQDSLKSLENISAARELQEIAKPIAEVEKSLHSLIPSETLGLEGAESLPFELNMDLLHHIDQYTELMEIVEEVSAVIKIDELQQSVMIARELRDKIVTSESEATAEAKIGILQEKNTKLAQRLQNAIATLQTQVFDSTQEVPSMLNPELLKRFMNSSAQLQGSLAAITGIQIAMVAPMKLISEDVMIDVVKETPIEKITDESPTVAETIEPVVLEQLTAFNDEEIKSESVIEGVTEIEASVNEVKEMLSVDNTEMLNREAINLATPQESAMKIQSTEPVQSTKQQEVPEVAMAINDSEKKIKEVEVESTMILKHCLEELISTDMTETLDKLAVVINTEELNQTVKVATELLENIMSTGKTTQNISSNIELTTEKAKQSELVQQLQNALLTVQEQIFDNYQQLEIVCDTNKLRKIADISVNLQTNLAAVVTVSDEVKAEKVTETEISASPSKYVSETITTQNAENVILENLLFIKPDEIANKQTKPPVSESEEIAMGISTQLISQEDQDVTKEAYDIGTVAVKATECTISGSEVKTADETLRAMIPAETSVEVIIKAEESDHVAVTEETTPLESVTDTESTIVDGMQDVKASETALVQPKLETLLHNIEAYISGEISEIVNNISDFAHLDELKQSLSVANILRDNIAALQIRVEKDEVVNLGKIQGEVSLEQVNLVHQLQNALIVLDTQLHDSETKLLPPLKKNMLQKVKEVVADLEGNLTIILMTTPPVEIHQRPAALTENISNSGIEFNSESYNNQENSAILGFDHQPSQIQQVTDLTEATQEIHVLPPNLGVESKTLEDHPICGEVVPPYFEEDTIDIQNVIFKHPVPSVVTELPETKESEEINAVERLLPDVEIELEQDTHSMLEKPIIENTSQRTKKIKESKQEDIFNTSSDLIMETTLYNKSVDLKAVKLKDLPNIEQMSISADLMQQMATKVDETLVFEPPISQEGTEEQKESISAEKNIADNEVVQKLVIDENSLVLKQKESEVLESKKTVGVTQPIVIEQSSEINTQTLADEEIIASGSKYTAAPDELSKQIETIHLVTPPKKPIEPVYTCSDNDKNILEQETEVGVLQTNIAEIIEPVNTKIEQIDLNKKICDDTDLTHTSEINQQKGSLDDQYTDIIQNSAFVKANNEDVKRTQDTKTDSKIGHDNLIVKETILPQKLVDVKTAEADQTTLNAKDLEAIIISETDILDASTTSIIVQTKDALPEAPVEDKDLLNNKVNESIFDTRITKHVTPKEEQHVVELIEVLLVKKPDEISEDTYLPKNEAVVLEPVVDKRADSLLVAEATTTNTEQESLYVTKNNNLTTNDLNAMELESIINIKTDKSEIIQVVQDESLKHQMLATQNSKVVEDIAVLQKSPELTVDKVESAELSELEKSQLNTVKPISAEKFSDLDEVQLDIVQKFTKSAIPEMHCDVVRQPLEPDKLLQHIEVLISGNVAEAIEELALVTDLPALKDTVEIAKELGENIVAGIKDIRLEETTSLVTPDTKQAQLKQKLSKALITLQEKILNATEEITAVLPLEKLERISEAVIHVQESFEVESVSAIQTLETEFSKSYKEDSMKQLECLLQEVTDKIDLTSSDRVPEDTEALRDSLDEVQTVIIKLKRDFDGANDTLNETLEDLECSVRSVQLQINEDSPPDLLKEACATLQLLVTNMSETNETCVSEAVIKEINLKDALDKCAKETYETVQLLEKATHVDTQGQSKLADIVINLSILTENMKSLKSGFVGNADTLIEKGIDIMQSLDHIEEKVFSIQKELDTADNLPSTIRDTIVTAVHSVYGSLSNMRGTVLSTQKQYMFENYGKPSENFLHSIKNVSSLTKVSNDESEKATLKKFLKSMRSVLNHFEDIKFYINLDKTARLPSDAAFTKIILDELLLNIQALSVIEGFDTEFKNIIKNTLKCVEANLLGIEERSSLEVKEKIPIFKEVALGVLEVTSNIKVALENRLKKENKPIIEQILEDKQELLAVSKDEKIEAVKLDTPKIQIQTPEDLTTHVKIVEDEVQTGLEIVHAKEEEISKTHEECTLPSTSKLVHEGQSKIKDKSIEEATVENLSEIAPINKDFAMQEKAVTVEKDEDEKHIPESIKQIESPIKESELKKVVAEKIVLDSKVQNKELEEAGPSTRPDILKKHECFADLENKNTGVVFGDEILKKASQDEITDGKIDKTEEASLKKLKIEAKDEQNVLYKEERTLESSEVSTLGVIILNDQGSNKLEGEVVQSIEKDYSQDQKICTTPADKIEKKVPSLTNINEETINKKTFIEEGLEQGIQTIENATAVDTEQKKTLQELSKKELAIKQETTEIDKVELEKSKVFEMDIQAKESQALETIQKSEKEMEEIGKENILDQKNIETKSFEKELNSCTLNVEANKVKKDEILAGTSKIAVEEIQTQKTATIQQDEKEIELLKAAVKTQEKEKVHKEKVNEGKDQRENDTLLKLEEANKQTQQHKEYEVFEEQNINKQNDEAEKENCNKEKENSLEEKRMNNEQEQETDSLRLEEEKKQQELFSYEKEIKLKSEKELAEKYIKEKEENETERLGLEQEKQQQEILRTEEEQKKIEHSDKQTEEETKLNRKNELSEKCIKREEEKETEKLRLEEEKKQQELLRKEEEELKKKALADKQKEEEMELKKDKELEEKCIKEEKDKETERLRLEEEKKQQDLLIQEEEELKKKALADKQKEEEMKLKKNKELEEKRIKEEKDKETERLRLEEEQKQQELLRQEEEELKKKALADKQKEEEIKLKKNKELEEKRIKEEKDKETERLRLEEEKKQQDLLIQEEEELKKKALADKQKEEEMKLKKNKELEEKRIKEENDKETERLRLEEEQKQQELLRQEEEELKKKALADKQKEEEIKLKKNKELEEKRIKEEKDKETERLRLEEEKKQQELLRQEEEELKKKALADKQKEEEIKLKEEKELEEKRIKEEKDRETENLRLEEEKKQRELLSHEEELKKRELADKQKEEEMKLKKNKELEEKRIKEEKDKETERLRLEEEKKQQDLLRQEEEELKKKALADKQKEEETQLKKNNELEEKRIKEEKDKETERLRLEEEKKQQDLLRQEEEELEKKTLADKQKEEEIKLEEEKELEEKRIKEEKDRETENLRLEEEKKQQELLSHEEEELKKKALANKQKEEVMELKKNKELEEKRIKGEKDKETERLRLEEEKKQQEHLSQEEQLKKKTLADKQKEKEMKLTKDKELEEKRIKEEQDKETEKLQIDEEKKQQEILRKEEELKKNELAEKEKERELKLKKEKDIEEKRITEEQDKETERLRLEQKKKQQDLLQKTEEERKKRELADKHKEEIKLKKDIELEENHMKEEQDKQTGRLRLEEEMKQQKFIREEEEKLKKKELADKQKEEIKLKEKKELKEKRMKEEQDKETEKLQLEEQKKQQELPKHKVEELQKKALADDQKGEEMKLKIDKELEEKRMKEEQDKEMERLQIDEEKKQQEILVNVQELKKKDLAEKEKERKLKIKKEKELEEIRIKEEQDKETERLRLEEKKKQQELLQKTEDERNKREFADKQKEETKLKKDKELKEKRIKEDEDKETARLQLEEKKKQQELLKKTEEERKNREFADKPNEAIKLKKEKDLEDKRIREMQEKETEKLRLEEEKIQQELFRKEEEELKKKELEKKQLEETELKKEKALKVKRKNEEQERKVDNLQLEEEEKQQDLFRKGDVEEKTKVSIEEQNEEELELMKVKQQQTKKGMKDEQEKTRIDKENEETSLHTQLQKEKGETRVAEVKHKEKLLQNDKQADELKEKKEEEYRFQKEHQEFKEADKELEKKRIENEKNKQNELAIQKVKEEADKLKKEKTDKKRLKKVNKDDKERQEKQKKDTEKSAMEVAQDLEYKKKQEEVDHVKVKQPRKKEEDAAIVKVASKNGAQKIDPKDIIPDNFKKGVIKREDMPEKSDKDFSYSKKLDKEYIDKDQTISGISSIKLHDETMIKNDLHQADKYSRRLGSEIKSDKDRLKKSIGTSDTTQHYIKEYHYEPSVRPKHEDREKPRFIDHNHRDYTMEFARPSAYREKTFEVDNINFEKNSGRGHIYKANNLVKEAQLRASAPPRAIVSESTRNSEPLERRPEVKHRSKALSEARSIISEKRTNASRDIKRKPVFSTFLTDRTAVEGSRVKLTCSVLSSSDPKVTWFKNGVLLDSKLKYKTKMIDGLITLEVLNAVPSDSAEYSCTVENENGSINSSANLKVYPSFEASPIPPTFTRSIRDTYHLAENELVLECRIRGQPLPTITWLKDDRVVNINERFQAYYLADGVCRLAISSPTPEDSGKYTCKAENSVWSDQITHVVNFTGQKSRLSPNIATIERSRFNRQAIESRRPHFGNVLTDYKVTRGGTIGLQVEIKGLPTRVEWLREGRSVIETYTNARTYVEQELYTLALSDVTERESGMYTCRAWSSHGTVDMNAAITVVQPNELEGKPAIIVGRPEKDVLISVGEDLNISFRVQGEPRAKVIFMKGIRDITNSQRVCKMTSDDYVKFTVKRSVISDAGTYCILARNAYGCDRAFVTVVVRQRASSENLISDWTYPMDDSGITVAERKYKSVPERIPAEPSVVDGGSNWVSIAWPKPDPSDIAPVLAYKVESWLVGKEGGARWTELGITPLNSFDAFNLKQGEEYHFRVTPRNRYGWGEAVQSSSPVGVGLSGDRPEFVDILPGQLKVLIGETANLSCSVKGKPTPEVVWMKNGHELEDEDSRVKTSFNGFDCSLVINGINPEDEARYSCEATNAHGRASTYARLAVVTDRLVWEADAKLKRERSADAAGEYPPQFTMRLRDRRVQATYPVRLTCQVVGCPSPSVTWYKDGEDVILDSRHTKSQDEHFHTLEIAPTTLEDGGVYEVMARNSCGAVSCHCNLVVDKGIRAYVAPEFCCGLEPLYRLQEGDELRISAVVEAYPTVGVTWYRDGVRLRPSRRAIMTLDRDGQIELALAFVTPRDAGVYTCTASNEVGRATTSGKVEVIGDASLVKKKTPPMLISPDVPYSKEPMFIRKPRSSEAREGDTVIIQCEVVGDPKPDVYWLRDFLKPDYYRDATHFKRIGNGPEYRFEIPHAKLDYTGAYSVVARNVHGEAKAIISLQILAKDPSSTEEHNIRYGRVDVIPRFERDLTDLLCYDGDVIEFECRVSGHPEPDIRWFHYTELIRENPDFEWSIDSGTVRLKIKQVTAEDEGTYLCEASNNLGKASTSACLVVYPPGEPNTLSQRLRRPPALLSAASTPRSTPRSTPARSVSRTPGPDPRRLCSPSRQMPPKFYTYPFNKVVEEGEHVVFQCAVKGLPAPWATWDKDGVIITPSCRVTIKEKDEILRILEIEEVSIEDVGVYRITLENDFGRVEASARLEVITQKGKFYAGVRSYSASPRKSLAFRRRPSRQD